MAADSTAPESLVVIGASAGGVEALLEVAAGFPADLPAAVCVTMHISPDTPSRLAQILSRAGPLPARQATGGDRLRAGEILVAPPGHHLLVTDGTTRLSGGPRENGHRPAIDVLFRSAARAPYATVIGVVLSGALDDGTAGLAAIKAAGGAAVVQEPADALFPYMPMHAIATVEVDVVAPARQIPDVVEGLSRGTVQHRRIQMEQPPRPPESEPPVATVCPDCGGLLTEDSQAPTLQWECKVGHRYSAASLADAQGQQVEDHIWAVIRSLEDRSKLLRRMADNQQRPAREATARLLRQRAEEAAAHAQAVRELRERVAAATLPPTPMEESEPAR